MLFKCFMTVDTMNLDATKDGEYEESHGWVDPRNTYMVEESRNYVNPVSDYDDQRNTDEYPTVFDWVRHTVEDFLGAAHDNGDGTWYAEDSQVYQGVDYQYALHFHAKVLVNGKWAEVPVT